MLKTIAIALTCLSLNAHAQFTLQGVVRDIKTNRNMEGATVQVRETGRLAITDAFGKFRITGLPEGACEVIIKYLGYADKTESIYLTGDQELMVLLEETTTLTDEVIVSATRAGEKSPTTFATVSEQVIRKQNFGQDLPFLLNWLPSVVTTSDAGAGIGYTGIRVRGSDATRVNVTINGIPLNDSESQGVFWVNTPDLASSTNNIQVQRGVGTSTNGAGAFGASIHVQTNALNADPYAEITAAAGSFDSQRLTFKAGTGLMKGWAFDGRISKITSDGYVERATADLDSYYLSGGYSGKKSIFKAIVFGGHEVTYQAWYGVDQATMEQNRTFNYAGAIYDENGNVSRYYDREVDDYRQDHYQFHFSHQVSASWNVNASLHYTYGRGYFEQYRQNQLFADLGLPDIVLPDTTFQSSDVIVRRWLDNDFYGTTFSANYEGNHLSVTMGGAVNTYTNARHFGEIIWAQHATNSTIRQVYYDGESDKDDANFFARMNYTLTDNLNVFADLQYRRVAYQTSGIDDDQSSYNVNDQFHFFNPKFGVSLSAGEQDLFYTSLAWANREPNRSDYLDSEVKPKPEQLVNLETGWRRNAAHYGLELNFYLMKYRDQLVLTGEINNTGYPVRANIGESYRTGMEISGLVRLSDKFSVQANATLSQNRNKDFVIVDETNEVTVKDTDIILSPAFVGSFQLNWNPIKNLQASWLSKVVSHQYLDNSQNESLTLDDYFTNDVRLAWQIPLPDARQVEIGALINNVLDAAYSSNGYAYDGVPYFFPQAGRNFMLMMTIKF